MGKVLAIHSENCSLGHGNPHESKAGKQSTCESTAQEVEASDLLEKLARGNGRLQTPC